NEIAKGMVYEFELPDWVGQASPPIKTSSADIKLVQIYEMPNPHNILPDNGNFYNAGSLAIDFDNAGNMYCTSAHFNATHPYATTVYRGDVIRFSTLGHNAGTNVYVVPMSGPDAAQLIISAQIEDQLGHADYGGSWGMAVRTSNNQLVLAPRSNCSSSP